VRTDRSESPAPVHRLKPSRLRYSGVTLDRSRTRLLQQLIRNDRVLPDDRVARLLGLSEATIRTHLRHLAQHAPPLVRPATVVLPPMGGQGGTKGLSGQRGWVPTKAGMGAVENLES